MGRGLDGIFGPTPHPTLAMATEGCGCKGVDASAFNSGLMVASQQGILQQGNPVRQISVSKGFKGVSRHHSVSV